MGRLRPAGHHRFCSAPSQRMVTAATFGSAILPCFTAISSARMLTAISCGVIAPMSRPIGAWMPLRRSRRQPFLQQLVVDPLHLRLAADEAEVAQGRRGQRAQRVEVVGVAARDDHGVRRRRQLVGGDPVGILSTWTSIPSPKRSVLANFSRSSMTCTLNPTSCAIFATK